MVKWRYVFESTCNPCEESGDEPYGEMYNSKLFDTKEEAEAYLQKRGGYKNESDEYATTCQYIEEVDDDIEEPTAEDIAEYNGVYNE